MMYGQGVNAMARKIGHTTESAAQIRRQMLSAMPKCARWMARVQTVAEQHHRVITAAGRILPSSTEGAYKSVNWVVQGSAADLLNNAIVEMEARGIGDAVMIGMHDELVISGDEECSREVEEIMRTPPEFLTRWAGRVPLLRTDRQCTDNAWAAV